MAVLHPWSTKVEYKWSTADRDVMPSTKRLQIRLTEDQHELISRTAVSKGLTVSELVLKVTTGFCAQIEAQQAPVKASLVVHASPAVKKEKPKRDPYKGMTYEQIQEAESNGGNYTDENGDTVSVRYN